MRYFSVRKKRQRTDPFLDLFWFEAARVSERIRQTSVQQQGKFCWQSSLWLVGKLVYPMECDHAIVSVSLSRFFLSIHICWLTCPFFGEKMSAAPRCCSPQARNELNRGLWNIILPFSGPFRAKPHYHNSLRSLIFRSEYFMHSQQVRQRTIVIFGIAMSLQSLWICNLARRSQTVGQIFAIFRHHWSFCRIWWRGNAAMADHTNTLSAPFKIRINTGLCINLHP